MTPTGSKTESQYFKGKLIILKDSSDSLSRKAQKDQSNLEQILLDLKNEQKNTNGILDDIREEFEKMLQEPISDGEASEEAPEEKSSQIDKPDPKPDPKPALKEKDSFGFANLFKDRKSTNSIY